jgi:D-ornithine 4,5-aminomutase subunit alpha
MDQRHDDFEARREHLRGLTDEELRNRFWRLVEQLVAPLVTAARAHTTPSIERSVLLRMGFSSIEAKAIVERMAECGELGEGAGRLVLERARREGLDLREAGLRWLVPSEDGDPRP